MQTKLTLRLDAALIASAKAFARLSGRSVSRMVADYFALLDAELTDLDHVATPIVSSIRGALSGGDADLLAGHRGHGRR
jgi:hypothetical protein